MLFVLDSGAERIWTVQMCFQLFGFKINFSGEEFPDALGTAAKWGPAWLGAWVSLRSVWIKNELIEFSLLISYLPPKIPRKSVIFTYIHRKFSVPSGTTRCPVGASEPSITFWTARFGERKKWEKVLGWESFNPNRSKCIRQPGCAERVLGAIYPPGTENLLYVHTFHLKIRYGLE